MLNFLPVINAHGSQFDGCRTVIAPAVWGATGLPQIDCFVSISQTTTDPSSWPPKEYKNFESHENAKDSIFTYKMKFY
jgi:hypothetical protein